MILVVDASVGLKWVLQGGQSAGRAAGPQRRDLLVPDFWLNEACNVLWLQVRRKLFTPEEAGAEKVVVADGPFVTAMQRYPDPSMAGILLPLAAWASGQGA